MGVAVVIVLAVAIQALVAIVAAKIAGVAAVVGFGVAPQAAPLGLVAVSAALSFFFLFQFHTLSLLTKINIAVTRNTKSKS